MVKAQSAIKRQIVAVLGLMGVLLMTGCATVVDKAAEEKAIKEKQRTAYLLDRREKVSSTAFVETVDPEKRQVVLRGQRGRLHPMSVDDGVRNLFQFRAGDRVEVIYHEALLLALEQSPPASAQAEARAAPDQMTRQDRELVATVAAVNRKTRKITLKGPEQPLVLKAPQDLDLRQVTVGNRVRATYAEALVLNMKLVSAKKKPRRR